MNPDYQLAALAASQAGFLSRDQVDQAGLTEAGLRTRISNGAFVRVHNGLYRVLGIESDYQGLLRGAMNILPDPTVSHQSAAELLELPSVPVGSPVVTVHAGTTHGFPGVRIHRSIDMGDHHRRVLKGMLTTTPARTLVDLAAVMRPSALAYVVDESLAAKLVTIDEVDKVFGEVARRGRTGSAAMRRILEDRIGSEMVSATRIERVGMSVFVEGGLPRPIWQYPAPWNPSKRIDFAWPHFCVGCECDSRRWHGRMADFQRDRERDNLALLHQWKIFRFTWEDLTSRPALVVAQLAAALAA